jgi:hypothetical protein
MTSLNRSTGQQGKTAGDPVAALGGYEKLTKRKIPSAVGDAQDQDLYNVKEHFRIVNKGFQTLRQGRTH